MSDSQPFQAAEVAAMKRPPKARQDEAYVRVWTAAQDHPSPEPDLERWVAAYADGAPVTWYRDKASGAKMDRPAWCQLEEAIRRGDVARLVVWRLDRLGRNAAALAALLEELAQRRVLFTSIREGIDLETPAGRMLGGILASVAAWERETLRERQAAGIAAARAAGRRWGGRQPGARWKVTPELERQVRQLHAQGATVAAIARGLGLARGTIYATLNQDFKGRSAQ